MTINTMDMQNILQETLSGFNSRVQQHYETVTDADLALIELALRDVLNPKVSDAANQTRQYNPATDQVEDI